MTTAQCATTLTFGRIPVRILGLLGGAALAFTATPGAAQVSDAILLNILRECAKIDDLSARLSCYDTNIRTASTSSVPGQAPAPQGGAAPVSPSAAGGFGADSIRTQERFNPERNGTSEISARVSAVREREPGVYLVTLDSGAEWLFAESTNRSFVPPRRGETVEIERGALGGYLMVVGRQQAVRVTRIK
jgi:hypothetical protein